MNGVRLRSAPVDRERWQARLDELSHAHGVPGASLAILRGADIVEVATGVLNVDTGVTATPDSLFQIGSITKTYTATLALELIERGDLTLDTAVVELLPELALTDMNALRTVTIAHLLTHTSGIAGDFFADTGRGDDVLARYIERCRELGFSHPVGETMSYCNTGYVIAGRVIERICDNTWDAALRDRLCVPLGLESTVTLPEEALRFRVAHGHVADPGQRPRLASTWALPRSMGPAGLICCTAADVVRFAGWHLGGGPALLSAPTRRAMLTPRVELPDRWTLGRYWGLGWILDDWDGRRVFGHDGATLGQAAFLRAVPDAGVAIALLTNGGHAGDLYQELYRELLDELCALRLPPPLEPPREPPTVDLEAVAGVYERVGMRIELEVDDTVLRARVIATGEAAALDDEDPVDEVALVPVAERLFVTRFGDERTWTPLIFYELPDGTPYLHMGARATPKIADVRN